MLGDVTDKQSGAGELSRQDGARLQQVQQPVSQPAARSWRRTNHQCHLQSERPRGITWLSDGVTLLFLKKVMTFPFIVVVLKSDDRLPSRLVSPVFFANSAKKFKLSLGYYPLDGVTRGDLPSPSDATVSLPSISFLSFLPLPLSFSRREVVPHIQLMNLGKRC